MIKIKNISEKARSLIPGHLKGGNLEGVVNSLTVAVQQAEDSIWDALESMSIKRAKGKDLDNIGQNLGVKRGLLGDRSYRARIIARSLARLSNGTRSDISKVVKAATDAIDGTIEIFDLGMRNVSIGYQSKSLEPVIYYSLTRQEVEASLPAGVRLDELVHSIEPAFSFEGGNGEGFENGYLSRSF